MSGWPWPADTLLDRARKVAIAYRTHFHTSNPTLCSVLDDAMREYGQLWVIPDVMVAEPSDDITTREAAARCGVRESTIRGWACQPHPGRPGEMLLPRFGWRMRERTYLVVHVDEAKEIHQAGRYGVAA